MVGGLAGIVGGVGFRQMDGAFGFFPLVAGLVRSTSPEAGLALHFAIAVIIGPSYGSCFSATSA